VRQKYTAFGGAERFVERALQALTAQGVDVEIIARQWNQANAGGRVGRIVDPFYLGRTWRDAGFASEVQAIIAAGDYDLVQSHERIPGCHVYRAGDGVHATWLELRDAGRAGVAKLGTTLSPWHHYILKAEAEMFRHPSLRAVICNSRMVQADIMRRFGTSEAKLPVIYNGVDLAHFHPGLRDEHRASMREKHSAKASVVLFVGSGYERKGLPALLQAFAQMQRKDAELWVVGRDKREAAMRTQAIKLGLNDARGNGRVRFFGPQPDVRPFYGAADVFALPTLYDPFPNAALEALACGLPLITTTSCGAAELVTEANGGVVAANDFVALAAQLDALCAPRRAETMRDAARGSVAALGLAPMAERLTALYLSLS
jgi:UDP-glucose:(heptosyl)LPS alpha-1,3-glucosyltransferase